MDQDRPAESGQATAVELPPTYYLDNFRFLLNDVSRRYRHILHAEEQAFLDGFLALAPAAQCLYVRLVSRKGPWFRLDRLNYPEIEDLPAACQALIAAGYAQHSPELLPLQLVSLFNLQELRQLRPLLPAKLKREQAQDWLLRDAQDWLGTQSAQAEQQSVESYESTDWYQWLGINEAIIQPLGMDLIQRFRLLFFGNLYQDLSEFVLTDLGRVRYENYALDGAAAAFKSREDLDELEAALDFRSQIEAAIESGDLEAILALQQQVRVFSSPAARRSNDKSINKLARELERRSELAAALVLYRQSNREPARERIARILETQGLHAEAVEICGEILAAPWDEQEQTAALRIRQRCLKHLGEKPKREVAPAISQFSRQVPRPRFPGETVEPTALLLLQEETQSRGFYVENLLFTGLFGLLFWDVIYQPVSDAFYHPFQLGPRDLYDADFVAKRQPQMRQIWQLLQHEQAYQDKIRATLQTKAGVANPFVVWEILNEELLNNALERIPRQHLQIIWRRMLADLRNHRSGFPDLILFPDAGGYELVEVKGPGDRLQDHQTRWLHFFAEQGIPARVMNLEYAESLI